MSSPVNHLGGKCPCIPFFIGGRCPRGEMSFTTQFLAFSALGIFMLPTLKNLESILVSVRPCMHPCTHPFVGDIVVKLHLWIPNAKKS